MRHVVVEKLYRRNLVSADLFQNPFTPELGNIGADTAGLRVGDGFRSVIIAPSRTFQKTRAKILSSLPSISWKNINTCPQTVLCCALLRKIFCENFDALKGAQKRTGSANYFCLSSNCCRKPGRDVVLCHHNLKICRPGMDVAPSCISKK
jgi:cytoskeletal protein CcmA (bactofilin family)